LARTLDSATRDALVDRVRFYRDLGLTEFYRRPVDPALIAQLEASEENSQPNPTQIPGAPSFPSFAAEVGDHETQPDLQEDQTIPSRNQRQPHPRWPPLFLRLTVPPPS